MKEHNVAFFGLYETWFKLLKTELGEEKALIFFRKVMETILENAYGKDFEKGKPSEFIRMVKQRDESVGVKVSFSEVLDNQFSYRFHMDVFPNLKGHLDAEKLADTYIKFKINYLLGEHWTYKTIKHIWHGNDCTEFLIYLMS